MTDRFRPQSFAPRFAPGDAVAYLVPSGTSTVAGLGMVRDYQAASGVVSVVALRLLGTEPTRACLDVPADFCRKVEPEACFRRAATPY